MPGITDAELTAMRAALEDLLPDACNLLSPTRASDGQGGFTETWGTIAGTVSCRLDWKQGTEIVSGGALRSYSGWMLTLPYDTTVLNTYRVEHGGNTYAVRTVDTDKSWPVVLRVNVDRI